MVLAKHTMVQVDVECIVAHITNIEPVLQVFSNPVNYDVPPLLQQCDRLGFEVLVG